jgi:alpha-L-rhamnosidase
VVRLRHAEVLAPDGNLNRANLQTARSEDFYTMRGDGTEEVYEPRFTYHGFRFVELFNFPGVPTVDTLRGQVVRAGAATGAMLFSEPILNKIARAVAWTEVSNLHSIPTSCENRDERTGWTGDNHLAMEGIMANFDSAAMYIKWLRDFTDLQDNAGTLPDVIPFAGTGPGHRPSDPVWSSAFVHLAWRLWRHFGDDRPMRRAFAGLKKYIAWLQADTAARGGLNATRSYYGDWIAVDQEPGSLTSAAYFFNDVALLSNISAALGQPADASTYAALASELKAQFSAAFLTEDMSMGLYQGQHWFGTDRATQGANAIALGMALTPDQGNRTWGSVYRGTLSHLGHSVQYSHNTHSTAGMYGMKHTFDVLWRTGNTQLAFEMLTSTTYPSFGGMVQNGATTLWELWSNAVGDSMNSHNHLMFSFIGPWMLQALVGLVLPTESAAPVGAPAAFCRPGWEDVTVKPMLVGGLGHAAASLQTMRGPLAVSWTLVTTQPPGGGACEERAGVRLRVSLPGNTRATVFVPIPQNGADVQVQELVEGAVVWRDGAFVPGAATGVIAASLAAPGEYAGGAIKIAVGSGSFEFELTSTV